MKLIAVIFIAVLFSSCSHYRWYAKHETELCAKCPQGQSVDNSQVDTVIYGEIQPDTIRIYGIDTITNTVIVDNPVYKIIKEKGEIKVITKTRRVPFTVTKYKSSSDKVKTITVERKYIPFWYWLLLPFVLMLGYYTRRFFFR